jgi:hypothetical protein
MPNSYGTPTRKELHQETLDESAKKAERIEKFFANHPELDPENEVHMDRALKNYGLAYSESEERVAKGFVDEQENLTYIYNSHEAAKLISEGAEKIMKQEKCSYLEAANKFCENPQNKEIVRCYAQGN